MAALGVDAQAVMLIEWRASSFIVEWLCCVHSCLWWSLSTGQFCTFGLLYPIVAWIVAAGSVGWFLSQQFRGLLEAVAVDFAVGNGNHFVIQFRWT